MKKVYTEYDIIQLSLKGKTTLNLGPEDILTPSAKDKVNELKIKIIRKEEIPNPEDITDFENKLTNKVVIGSDHTGYQLKKKLIEYLEKKSYEVFDVGTYSETSCDYPDITMKVVQQIISGEKGFGVMIDATGIPSAITANKVPGIRAATCYNEFTAKSAREHNNANILVMGAKAIGEETAYSILDMWLKTNFAGGRHQRRLDKITAVEKHFGKNDGK
jgi:ribose 5-phosphate isomerase B